jgi:hypothetical protein
MITVLFFAGRREKSCEINNSLASIHLLGRGMGQITTSAKKKAPDSQSDALEFNTTER